MLEAVSMRVRMNFNPQLRALDRIAVLRSEHSPMLSGLVGNSIAIVSPHAYDFHNSFVFVNLINDSVLNIDASRKSPL